MTASSRPSANRPGTDLVVMGCAGEDAESLREALEALRRDGLEVELCEGLDHDPKRLSELIERHDGRGLYVLCRSPALGRERVEELREILLARHIPFARTLTVAVGGRGALADRIRSGLRRASARASGPNRVVASAGAPRLVATGRSRPVQTNATEDEEPTLVGKRELGEADELEPASLPPRPTPRPAPPSPPSARAAEVSVVEAIDAELLTEDTNTAPSSTSDLDLSDLDQNTGRTRALPPETTSVGRAPALITGNTSVGPMPAMITGDTLVGEKLPWSLREAASHWPPAMDPPTTDPIAAGLEPATMPLRRPPSPPGPSYAPSAPSPLATMAPDPWASAPAYPAAGSPPAAAAMASPNGRSKMLPWALGGVALLLLVLVIALAATNGPDTPEVASGDTPDTNGAASATPAPDETPLADDTKATSTPKTPPVYPVVTALRSRQARALDVLLIATTRGQPSDYPAATAFCDALEIEGLRGWRLPHIGELRSLTTANMIGRGMYWSSTAADTFGDDHLAWNVRRGNASAHDDDAVAVCVRGEAASGS